MNPTSVLLRDLTVARVRLAITDDGESVRFAPLEAVDAGLLERIKGCKPVLVPLIRRAAGADAISACDLEKFAGEHLELVDPEMASWSEDARFTYEERLGVAADLGLATSPGSEAEQIARREARRAHAGIPADWNQSRTPDIFDAALESFAPLGGLSLVREEPTRNNPHTTTGKDAPTP